MDDKIFNMCMWSFCIHCIHMGDLGLQSCMKDFMCVLFCLWCICVWGEGGGHGVCTCVCVCGGVFLRNTVLCFYINFKVLGIHFVDCVKRGVCMHPCH